MKSLTNRKWYVDSKIGSHFIWNLLYITSYIVSAYSNFPLQEIDNEIPT